MEKKASLLKRKKRGKNVPFKQPQALSQEISKLNEERRGGEEMHIIIIIVVEKWKQGGKLIIEIQFFIDESDSC